MTLITDRINSMTSSDYKATDIYRVQETAYIYCDGKTVIEIEYTGVWTDATFDVTLPNQAMALTMLAVALLREGRRDIRSRDSDVVPRSIEMLFTEEMRDLLLIGEEDDEEYADEGVMWENENPTEHWEVF